MQQTRLMSLLEAVANVALGYVVAVLTQMLVFPMFGLEATLEQNLAIGAKVFVPPTTACMIILYSDDEPHAPAALRGAAALEEGSEVTDDGAIQRSYDKLLVRDLMPIVRSPRVRTYRLWQRVSDPKRDPSRWWGNAPGAPEFSGGAGVSGAFLEAPALVAGPDDLAVMGEPVSSSVVIFASPKTLGHSPKAKLVVTITEVRS